MAAPQDRQTDMMKPIQPQMLFLREDAYRSCTEIS